MVKKEGHGRCRGSVPGHCRMIPEPLPPGESTNTPYVFEPPVVHGLSDREQHGS